VVGMPVLALRGGFGDRAARTVERVALALAPLAAVALAVGALIVGVPHSGEAGFWETSAQGGLLALYGLAWLVALRWRMIGATVMTVAAVGLGALSALQYRPWQGLGLALLLFAPAGLLWLTWQRSRGPVPILALATVLAVVLAGSGTAATRVWDHFYGPKSPQSALRALPVDQVEWLWSGGVTATSAAVVAGLARPVGDDVRLVFSTSPDLTRATSSVAAVRSPADAHVARFDLVGLAPGAEYHYAIRVAGQLDGTRGRGRLRTPAQGAQSFSFAFASCARLHTNARTFDAIRAVDPLLFLPTGDLFYGDIARNDVGQYRRDLVGQLTEPAPAALLREVPVAYMWDDHDYGRNDADRTSPSRPAAWTAYRAFVPHYPLVLGADEGPVAQAFTIGRVRFILTDLRSERDPKTDPAGADKTMMGPEQRAWFEAELLAANKRFPLIVWVSSVPWIDRSASPGDDWGAYADERTAIAQFVADHGIRGLVLVAGDAHMVAADDGAHSDFSATGGAGFPVLQAAPLDQHPSSKGGPYSEGAVPGTGQFGLVTVTDTGGPTVGVEFRGISNDASTLLRYAWTSPSSSTP